MNYGVVVTKYTGARGKSTTSDASAEFMGEVRRMLDEENIVWQTGELGIWWQISPPVLKHRGRPLRQCRGWLK